MKRKIYIGKTVLFVAVVFFLNKHVCGEPLRYAPVDDPLGYSDNFLYRQWCKETFEKGDFVYEGYKKIAFDIKFVPEKGTDFWQTPIETLRIGSGDCEDAMFLFLDYLAYSQDSTDSAKIIWGWVDNKADKTKYAHVWCQLLGRDGREYIVEAYSQGWDGIIPMDYVRNFEERRPIFELSCSEFNKLNELSSLGWVINIGDREVLVFDEDVLSYGYGYLADEHVFQQKFAAALKPNEKIEIKKIIENLHKFFIRKNNE